MTLDFLPLAYTCNAIDTFKQKDVKLVTATKGLYYCINMGGNGGRKEALGGNPYTYKMVVFGNNKNGKE